MRDGKPAANAPSPPGKNATAPSPAPPKSPAPAPPPKNGTSTKAGSPPPPPPPPSGKNKTAPSSGPAKNGTAPGGKAADADAASPVFSLLPTNVSATPAEKAGGDGPATRVCVLKAVAPAAKVGFGSCPRRGWRAEAPRLVGFAWPLCVNWPERA
jgi:hypothetical protein